MMSATTTRDPDADAADLQLAPAALVQEAAPGIILDPDSSGCLVGIEVLNLRQRVADGGAALAARRAA